MFTTKLLRLLIATIASVVAVSCSTPYEPSSTDPTKVATVKPSHKRDSLFTWRLATITGIEGLRAKKSGFAITVNGEKYYVDSGSRSFVIQCAFNGGSSGFGPFNAIADVKANLQAGKSYRVKCQPEGAKVNVWIEEETTQKKVSGVEKVAYQRTPQSTTIFLPAPS